MSQRCRERADLDSSKAALQKRGDKATHFKGECESGGGGARL